MFPRGQIIAYNESRLANHAIRIGYLISRRYRRTGVRYERVHLSSAPTHPDHAIVDRPDFNSTVEAFIYRTVFRDAPPTFQPALSEAPPILTRSTNMIGRRRMQVTHLQLLQDPQLQEFATNAMHADAQSTCGRCRHHSIAPHSTHCRNTSYQQTGACCPYCGHVTLTLSDFRKHASRCYGSTKLSRNQDVEPYQIYEVQNIKLVPCVVPNCTFQTHIYSWWMAHAMIHRFMRHRQPGNRLPSVYLGQIDQWHADCTSGHLSPPLYIQRIMGSIVGYVQTLDHQRRWEISCDYKFPDNWPQKRVSDVTPVVTDPPSVEHLLPFCRYVSLDEAKNMPLDAIRKLYVHRLYQDGGHFVRNAVSMSGGQVTFETAAPARSYSECDRYDIQWYQAWGEALEALQNTDDDVTKARVYTRQIGGRHSRMWSHGHGDVQAQLCFKHT